MQRITGLKSPVLFAWLYVSNGTMSIDKGEFGDVLKDRVNVVSNFV